jgi:hypothetical protein
MASMAVLSGSRPFEVLPVATSSSRTCSWMNGEHGYAPVPRCVFLWLAIDPCTKLLPVLYLGPRPQNAAHRVIHSLRELLAPGCLPLFTSDGLNMYFYALTAHFGHWRQVCRRGRNVLRWQVAKGLIYGQVKKSYQRRKLVRVTHVMRLGTEAALKASLQGMGFSGRLNTAFIERAPLTVRHGRAALARRTWATAKPPPPLLAHLEWWRAYYHGCRVLTNHCEWRSCSRASEGASWWRNALGSVPLQWPRGKPPDDRLPARCSLPHCRRFPLESQEAQVQGQCHVMQWLGKVQAEEVGWGLTPG